MEIDLSNTGIIYVGIIIGILSLYLFIVEVAIPLSEKISHPYDIQDCAFRVHADSCNLPTRVGQFCFVNGTAFEVAQTNDGDCVRVKG